MNFRNRFDKIDTEEPPLRLSTNRLLEQIKHREASVSLHNAVAVSAIADFIEHLKTNGTADFENPSLDLQFKFTTNAGIAMEKGTEFPGGRPGIAAWEAVRKGELTSEDEAETVAKIRELLLNIGMPVGSNRKTWNIYRSFISDIEDEKLTKLIRNFEWSMNSISADALGPAIERRLIEKNYATDEREAQERHGRLYIHVSRLLTHKGPKKLTKDALVEQLRQPSLTDEERIAIRNLQTVTEYLKQKVQEHDRELAEQRGQLAQHGEQLTGLRGRVDLIEAHNPSRKHEIEFGQSQPRPAKSMLRKPTHPLIGRKQEVEACCSMLRRDDVTILTLTGTPGTGKTSLALEVATIMQGEFKDGVYFVPLASVRKGKRLIFEIARALDVYTPHDARIQLRNRLRDYLRGKQVLLCLDNFEQIAEEAGEVLKLLAYIPGTDSTLRPKVLITSRASLHIGGNEFPVPPLQVPNLKGVRSLENLSQASSVQFFVQCARSKNPSFELTADNVLPISQICVRLDGIPLAIELAASRLSLLSPAAILSKLGSKRDRSKAGSRLKLLAVPKKVPARQRTMRDAIKLSYKLLNAREKALFRTIGIFVGGCTLEAVQAVAFQSEGSAAANLVLEGAQSLINKSLIQSVQSDGGESRLMMLEPLRDFALEQMQKTRKMQKTQIEMHRVQRRHAEYFLSLAKEADEKAASSDRIVWLDKLEAENDNLWAVLDWSKETGGPSSIGLELAGLLWWYWYLRSYISEICSWIESMLETASVEESTAHEAQALITVGFLYWAQRDLRKARARLLRSVEILDKIEDLRWTRWKAIAQCFLGIIALNRLMPAEARDWLKKCGALFEGIKYIWGVGATLCCLGDLALFPTEHTATKPPSIEGIEIKPAKTEALSNSLARRRAEALPLYEASLEIWRQMEDPWSLTITLTSLGKMYSIGDDDHEVARGYIDECIDILGNVGARWNQAQVMLDFGDAAMRQVKKGYAASLFKRSLRLWFELASSVGGVSCLIRLAVVASKQDQAHRGIKLLGATQAIISSNDGFTLDQEMKTMYELCRDDLKSRVTDREWDDSWSEGRNMSFERAVEYAWNEDATGAAN